MTRPMWRSSRLRQGRASIRAAALGIAILVILAVVSVWLVARTDAASASNRASQPTPAGCTDEFEPNDSITATAPITIYLMDHYSQKRWSARVFAPDDRDYYRVSVLGGFPGEPSPEGRMSFYPPAPDSIQLEVSYNDGLTWDRVNRSAARHRDYRTYVLRLRPVGAVVSSDVSYTVDIVEIIGTPTASATHTPTSTRTPTPSATPTGPSPTPPATQGATRHAYLPLTRR